MTGLVVRVGPPPRVRAASTRSSRHRAPTRSSCARLALDLRDFQRRPGEVVLASDVLDHQLVDVDGVRVVRAADLYLARLGRRAAWWASTSASHTLLRRLGPARWRRRATPDRVIDWAAIQPFGTTAGGPRAPDAGQRGPAPAAPGELADLLEELRPRPSARSCWPPSSPRRRPTRSRRWRPTSSSSLLRESPDRAGGQAARRDGARRGGRRPARPRRGPRSGRAARRRCPPSGRRAAPRCSRYPEDDGRRRHDHQLVAVAPSETVGAGPRDRPRARPTHRADIDAVVRRRRRRRAWSTTQRCSSLFLAEPDDIGRRPGRAAEAGHRQRRRVARRGRRGAGRDPRGSSVVVVDEDGRPLGRILADDVVDALVPPTEAG